MIALAEAKKRWRAMSREIFLLNPPALRLDLDAGLAENLAALAEQCRPRRIFGFAPLPDEPDILPFLRRWLAGGGLLALPVWDGSAGMVMRAVACLDTELRPGRGGIAEPVADCPAVDGCGTDMVLVPGRYFSSNGDRLGRGAGCYDGFLRRHAVMAVGVAYEFQICPAIPAGDHDVPVDCIATPSRILRRTRDGCAL